MGQLGWIDFSSDDRDKVRQVLALAAEKGTLDELGVGQIRDAFSDLLFPGISTIQTRAKYFITVPRIVRDFQDLKHSDYRRRKGLQDYLTEEENDLAETLVNIHGTSETGIIGSTTIGSGGVKRLPSEVYWNGLRTFGLVNTHLSLGEFSRRLSSDDVSDRGHDEDNDDSNEKENLISIPDYDEYWWDENTLKIQLTRKEAEFLQGKMIERPELSYSISVQLFKYGLVEKALEKNNNSRLVPFDILTELMLKHDQVDIECKKTLRLARDFSLAMEGPHIRLNILLARANGFDDSAEEYEDEYSTWLESASDKKVFEQDKEDAWLSLNVNGQQRNVKNYTRTFIRNWCEAIRNNTDTRVLDEIVISQSKNNKGKRSLLKRKLNDDGWIGVRRLDYRWSAAKLIIQDIHEGLHAKP